jgi:hypothetical protein
MFLLFLLPGCGVGPGAVALAEEVPLRLDAFDCTDPAAFRIASEDGEPCLDLFAASSYRPPHRSPLALALVAGPPVGDFTLTVEARQTGREYPHRDLVLVFGHRDAAHFGYVHLASAADANAHHVQVVDGADRRPVTTARSGGVAWGSGWHLLRLERRGRRVAVFFDGGEEPVLQGLVPPWPGRVGVGSFDDTGRFRRLTLARVRTE